MNLSDTLEALALFLNASGCLARLASACAITSLPSSVFASSASIRCLQISEWLRLVCVPGPFLITDSHFVYPDAHPHIWNISDVSFPRRTGGPLLLLDDARDLEPRTMLAYWSCVVARRAATKSASAAALEVRRGPKTTLRFGEARKRQQVSPVFVSWVTLPNKCGLTTLTWPFGEPMAADNQ